MFIITEVAGMSATPAFVAQVEAVQFYITAMQMLQMTKLSSK